MVLKSIKVSSTFTKVAGVWGQGPQGPQVGAPQKEHPITKIVVEFFGQMVYN